MSMTTRLTIVSFLLLQAFLVSCGASENRVRSIFPRETKLCVGDVVMRRGLGFASHAVTFVDRGGAYSHIGIVAWEDGKWMVVHAVPGEPDFPGDEDRVKMEPLDVYFRSDRAVEGCVLRCVDSLAATRAAREAINVYRRGTLFDHDYDDADTTRMYCCELVEHAYSKAGLSLVGAGIHDISMPGFWFRHVVLPSDFLSAPRLRRVIAF